MKTITKNALTNNAEKKQKKKQSNKKKKKKKRFFSFFFVQYTYEVWWDIATNRKGQSSCTHPGIGYSRRCGWVVFCFVFTNNFLFLLLIFVAILFFVLGVDSRRDICFKKITKKYNEEIIQRIFGMTILLGMEFPRPLKSQTLRTHTTWSALILFCFALTWKIFVFLSNCLLLLFICFSSYLDVAHEN